MIAPQRSQDKGFRLYCFIYSKCCKCNSPRFPLSNMLYRSGVCIALDTSVAYLPCWLACCCCCCCCCTLACLRSFFIFSPPSLSLVLVLLQMYSFLFCGCGCTCCTILFSLVMPPCCLSAPPLPPPGIRLPRREQEPGRQVLGHEGCGETPNGSTRTHTNARAHTKQPVVCCVYARARFICRRPLLAVNTIPYDMTERNAQYTLRNALGQHSVLGGFTVHVY